VKLVIRSREEHRNLQFLENEGHEYAGLGVPLPDGNRRSVEMLKPEVL
jgi:hypothetical protein